MSSEKLIQEMQSAVGKADGYDGTWTAGCCSCDFLVSDAHCNYCLAFYEERGRREREANLSVRPGMYASWREFWRESFWIYSAAVVMAALTGAFVLPHLFRALDRWAR